MKEIPLTKGQVALVDDAVLEHHGEFGATNMHLGLLKEPPQSVGPKQMACVS
jgi:hypothetical protein